MTILKSNKIMKKQVLIISLGIIVLLMSSSCKNGLFTKPLEEVLTSNTIIAKYMLNHLSLPCN